MKICRTDQSFNWSILGSTEWKYAQAEFTLIYNKLIKIWDSFSWLITDNWSIVQTFRQNSQDRLPIDDMRADRFYMSGRKLAQYNNILIDR